MPNRKIGIIGAGPVGSIMAAHLARNGEQVFLIDISVPRNIDPEINELENVYLYNIDDLQGVVNANVFERRKEAEKAEEIVEGEIETFLKWQSSLDSFPTIKALRERAEEMKKEELDKLLNKVAGLGEKDKEAIEYMATALMNKLIHPPTVALKDSSEDKESLVALVRKLYGIDEE